MINKYVYKELTWIDLESPTRDEVKQVMQEFAIDPLVAQELLSPSVRPKMEMHPNFLYFVLHIPTFRRQQSRKIHIDQEIDFILSHNFIITTHYDDIDPLHKFSRIFEVNSILDKAAIGQHAGYIFYYMLKRVYDGLMDELDSIDDSLHQIEVDIFEGKEKEMVLSLSATSRNLLDFKHAILHHRDILNGLQTVSTSFFDANFGRYVQSLIDEYEKIHEIARAHSELLTELRSTNDSILSTKQNETMKVFTVMAFSTLPISLAISIISIQSPWNPILGLPYDFWIIVGATLISIMFLILYFKYKKWL
jgi:magnesium transporter